MLLPAACSFGHSAAKAISRFHIKYTGAVRKGKTAVKKTLLAIALFVVLAIPIPISVASWIGTVMQMASLGKAELNNAKDWMLLVASLATMLLAGTYAITYVYSLAKTIKSKEIAFASFLPVWHAALTYVFFLIWGWLEKR